MGIGSSGVVNCANTYLGTANYTVADGYVADRTVIVDGNGPAQLNLNFARDEVLDPRITFSRTSNATRVNAQGLIEYAPHNLLTYSEQFDNAAWTKVRANTIANATTAPDGTTTADKLIDDGATVGQGYVGQNVTYTNIPYNFSFYAKAGEVTSVRCYIVDSIGIISASNAIVDLTSGTVTSGSANVVSIGNGWWRITVSGTPTAGSGSVRVLLPTDTATTDGFYIWGAQLNQGELQPYYSTTVKNLLGYSQNFENAAWTKSNSSVLYNLTPYSRYESGQWTFSAASVGDQTKIGVDGTSLTAFLANATTSAHRVNRTLSGSYTANSIYTFSFYVAKPAISDILGMAVRIRSTLGGQAIGVLVSNAGENSTYTFSSSTPFGTNPPAAITASNFSATNVGNNWVRISVTTAIASIDTTLTQWDIGFSTASGTDTGLGTANSQIFIDSVQLVQSTSPEEYTVTTSASAPIQAIGPFGFDGGQKLVENTVNAAHGVNIDVTALPTTRYTVSSYIKAGERTWARIALIDNLGVDGGRAWFDLVNGVVGNVDVQGAGSNITASIVAVGNGWYRCSVSGQMNNSKTTLTSQIRLARSNGDISYTGDGTSGIYIFGAQLSDSASLDPYSYNTGAAPTSTAYYGPRFDYDPVTLAPKGLLIEEQRINILLNSDTLSTQLVSVTAQAYTLSFYGTGSVALSGAYTGSLVGTGAYPNRVQLTFTPIIGILTLTVTGSVRYANLEAGSFPTSYIPTTSAQVTRAADNASMTGTNFSSWYNQSEGTIFAAYSRIYSPVDTKSSFVVDINDTTLNNRMGIYGLSNQEIFNDVVGGLGLVSIPVSSSFAANTLGKLAGTYKLNDFAAASNGILGTPDTSGTLPTVTQIRIGDRQDGVRALNGHLKSFKYFNKRLLNSYLQSLTQ